MLVQEKRDPERGVMILAADRIQSVCNSWIGGHSQTQESPCRDHGLPSRSSLLQKWFSLVRAS